MSLHSLFLVLLASGTHVPAAGEQPPPWRHSTTERSSSANKESVLHLHAPHLFEVGSGAPAPPAFRSTTMSPIPPPLQRSSPMSRTLYDLFKKSYAAITRPKGAVTTTPDSSTAKRAWIISRPDSEADMVRVADLAETGPCVPASGKATLDQATVEPSDEVNYRDTAPRFLSGSEVLSNTPISLNMRLAYRVLTSI